MTKNRSRLLIAVIGCLCLQCVNPTIPWWDSYSTPSGFQTTDGRTAFEGWWIAVSFILDDSLALRHPGSAAVELRCQQARPGVLLGLDSLLIVDGFVDSAGARKITIQGCPVRPDFQYFYHCCLRQSPTGGKSSDYCFVDLYVRTVDEPSVDTVSRVVSLRLLKEP